jgi:hypothetical protein
MPLYNVYAETGEGSRMARIYSFTASDDGTAKQFVTDRLTDKPVELWCFSKRVARFEGKQQA